MSRSPSIAIGKDNASTVGQIDHAQIGTGIGPVLAGLGFGLRVLGLDLVKLLPHVRRDVGTSRPVIELKIANALMQIPDRTGIGLGSLDAFVERQMSAVDASDADVSRLGRISGRSTLLPSGLNVVRCGGKCFNGLAQNAQMRR